MPGPYKPHRPTRGGESRANSWKRGGPSGARGDDGPSGPGRDRPAGLRLAGARADLERALRELDDAAKALASPSVKLPDSSVLEHLKELDLDAVFAPYRRVRASLIDVERAREKIDYFKFPKKDMGPQFPRRS